MTLDHARRPRKRGRPWKARVGGTTRRGETQREELLEAAIELFSANGYAGTSIRDLAKRTGRSVSNTYHYFRDKESLWLAILEYSAHGLPARLRDAMSGCDSPLERFRRLMRAHLEESIRRRREARIFFIDEERLSPAGKRFNMRIQKDIYGIYLAELGRLKAAGFITTSSLRVLVFNVLSVINCYVRWQDRIAGEPAGTLHEEIIEFVLFGMHGMPDAHRNVPTRRAAS